MSTYSSKPLSIHEAVHNYIEKESKVINPLEKIIAASTLRRKLKKGKSSKNLLDQDNYMRQYPLKVQKKYADSDEDLIPCDFKNYKSSKFSKFKSSASIDS